MTWNNVTNIPSMLMARFLRRRGWVVFYLDEKARKCNDGTCWMELYRETFEDKA